MYIYGVGRIKSGVSTGDNWYLYNAHGDVMGIADGNGSVVKEYNYDAFGNEKNADENDMNPWRYCGEYFDKETDTVYLRTRDYNPAIGRFMTEDPIKSGLNWYGYVEGDHVNFWDPSGKLT